MNSGFRTIVLALLGCSAIAGAATAQTNYFFRPVTLPSGAPPLPGGPGLDGNWFTEEDGDPFSSGGTNWYDINGQNFIPAYDFGSGERAFIENGGTAFVNSVETFSPGQIVMGSAGGTNGTLEIQNGGVITSRIGSGVNGNINVGSSGGVGTLRVLAGGAISAEGTLTQGTNSANMIRVGELTGPAATLSANSAFLPSQVQVFPNAAFSTNAGATFTNSSTFTSEVTANGAAGKIVVGTGAGLNGTLNLSFNSYTPTVGHNWNVIEASSVAGNFDSIISNANLAANHALVATRPSIGGGRVAYNIAVHEVLVLEVNRDTGAAVLKHPGSSNIQLDGYFIGSDAGSLSPANWNSWDAGNHFGGDWLATDARPDNLAELKPAGDATLNGGNTLNYQFGNIYNALAGPFGTVNEDLEFRYRRSSDGAQFPGKVVYTGTKFNTLLLQVDPTGAGDAFLRNTSDATVQIDAYDILSSAGQLSTAGWNSFDEQNFGGADTWLEVNSTANLLGEVNQTGFTTLAPGAALNLGKLFTGGTQDLQFSFLLQGQEEATPGHVLYEPFGSSVLLGDTNNDGIVNGFDIDPFVLVLTDLPAYQAMYPGVDGVARADINLDGSANGFDIDPFVVCVTNGGCAPGAGSAASLSLAAGAVPEPSAMLLLAVMATALAAVRRK